MSTISAINVDNVLQETCKGTQTCKHYAYMLRLLEKRMGKPLNEVLTTPYKSINTINETFQELQTRKSFFSAVCAMMRHQQFDDYKYKDAWCNQSKKVNDALRERYEDGKATSRQEETYVPWSQIVAAYDVQRRDPMFPTKEQLLLAMYVLEPPKRLDYGNVKIVDTFDDASGGNTLVLPVHSDALAVLVLREYKTSKKYGTQTFTLNKELTQVIRMSLSKQPRSHLFMNNTNKLPMTDQAYAKFVSRALTKMIGPGVTVNTLRHSIIKHVYGNPKTTHKERVELSRRMCHSIGMQSAYAYDLEQHDDDGDIEVQKI